MTNANGRMYEFISNYITESDVYAAKVIAKISTFIIKYRKNNRMSQKDFAKMMNVTQSMVSKWESCEYNFTIENIAKISEKLGVVFDIEFTAKDEYLYNDIRNVYQNIDYRGNLDWADMQAA